MIRTFCILKKMTFSAFHYLTLSVRCEHWIIYGLIQKEYWCLIWNMNMQSASSIWSKDWELSLFFFFFLFFKDIHYNTMIRTFCILKKMTFSAFHYLTLSVRCEELDAIRAKIGPTSDVDKIFSKMYSQYVLFINKYS
jgi:hypothetical protein